MGGLHYNSKFDFVDNEMESYPVLKMQNAFGSNILLFYYEYKSIDFDNNTISENAKISSIEIYSSKFKTREGISTNMKINTVQEIIGSGYLKVTFSDDPSCVFFDKYDHLKMYPDTTKKNLLTTAQYNDIIENGEKSELWDTVEGGIKLDYVSDRKINGILLH